MIYDRRKKSNPAAFPFDGGRGMMGKNNEEEL